ncbi:cytochrome P450 [Mycolicibacterium fluoranthenivorans]|jgi:cytochrome P450|uniref:Cytochrome P450 n=1 Tax=Mycolicibacterium fluoranthenivorans TaxID=258505 RepID=A0A1G4V3S7_9MYCO|nr:MULTISPECIES: cytochrome P450 [Mycobacteriaceae]MCV7255108.1 cytochrome P450 [Mycobacterium hackensackense]QNJ91792.1 cytochrome P450 [Mycolicibacterium fluoranthenivorans]SCX00732.1 Cytochrome P450 [Mycolicibacterium fluoranthenivorans]
MADGLTDLDFFRDPQLVEDPYPYFAALRSGCPVHRNGPHGVTMVTGWDEAVQVYNDADTFSSVTSVTGPFPGFPVSLEGLTKDEVTALIEKHRNELPFSDQLPTLDPPTHTDHRALLMRLITPKRLKENEDAMWKLADEVLDTFLDGGRGEFIKGFASPFTLLVIADLLGIPEEDRDSFIDGISHNAGGGVGGTGEEALAHSPLEFLYDLFASYVSERRENPRDDVMTGMATATFPDGSIPDVGDVARVATNVFSAGQETTVRLLGTALKVIAEQPAVQAALREDRSLIPNFIEEALRIESPVKGDFRLSRCPVTVGETELGSGTTVMVLNGAANRDPRRFSDPDTFDPARKNARQHLAFGRGIHSCPGAPLARAETKVALERLLDRTTDIRIAEDKHGSADSRRYKYIPTFILRGLVDLHLEFDT